MPPAFNLSHDQTLQFNCSPGVTPDLILESTRAFQHSPKILTITAKTLCDERPHHLVNHSVKELQPPDHHRPAEKRKFNKFSQTLSTPPAPDRLSTPATRTKAPITQHQTSRTLSRNRIGVSTHLNQKSPRQTDTSFIDCCVTASRQGLSMATPLQCGNSRQKMTEGTTTDIPVARRRYLPPAFPPAS